MEDFSDLAIELSEAVTIPAPPPRDDTCPFCGNSREKCESLRPTPLEHAVLKAAEEFSD
jgi:hypothetical protein